MTTQNTGALPPYRKAREVRLTAVAGACMNKTLLRTSEEGAKYARQFYHEDIALYESFFLILLNRANRVIGWAKISQGGCVSTVVDRKIIAKYAIDSLAEGVMLVHNHPSGNRNPSPQDDGLTAAIKEGLDLFNIKVLDSIILTPEDGYYSYCDNGKL